MGSSEGYAERGGYKRGGKKRGEVDEYAKRRHAFLVTSSDERNAFDAGHRRVAAVDQVVGTRAFFFPVGDYAGDHLLAAVAAFGEGRPFDQQPGDFAGALVGDVFEHRTDEKPSDPRGEAGVPGRIGGARGQADQGGDDRGAGIGKTDRGAASGRDAHVGNGRESDTVRVANGRPGGEYAALRAGNAAADDHTGPEAADPQCAAIEPRGENAELERAVF